MATTLTPPIKTNIGTFIYRWTGTAPFRIWNNETFTWITENTEDTEIEVFGASTIEPPALEVFDSTESTVTPEGLTYAARAVFQWRGYKYADYYRIDRDTGSGFEEVTKIWESGLGYYQFQSAILLTGVQADYQIVTVDKYGATSTTPITPTLVTLPVLLDLSYTYNAGTGNLTIDEV